MPVLRANNGELIQVSHSFEELRELKKDSPDSYIEDGSICKGCGTEWEDATSVLSCPCHEENPIFGAGFEELLPDLSSIYCDT